MQVNEIIGSLQLHEAETDSEFRLTTIVLRLAEHVIELQAKVDKLENPRPDFLSQVLNEGDGVYIDRPHQKRGVVQSGMIQTLKTSGNDVGVVNDLRIRKLTPRECFRLMGLNDNQIDRIFKSGNSNAQLYKQAGNSIVVQVLEAIFKEMI